MLEYEEKEKIRQALEREDLERFQTRVQQRQEALDAVKNRYATTRNVNNRRNMLWLFFAILLAGIAWFVSRIFT